MEHLGNMVLTSGYFVVFEGTPPPLDTESKWDAGQMAASSRKQRRCT